jgi:hypothetical protein
VRRRALLAAASAVTAAAVAAGGVALASSNWGPGTVATPRGYFDFCQDKQRDIGGITADDLAGVNNGGNAYEITGVIYENTAPGTPDQISYDNPAFFDFVRVKSGITTDYPTAPANRVLVAQFVEYSDTAKERPTQIRCKLREPASLNAPGFQKELDSGPASTVPWGFGAGTATGTPKDCAGVNQETVTNAWAQLTETEKDDAPYRPEPRDGDPVNIDVVPDTTTPTGPDWTTDWQGLQDDAGTLLVRAKSSIVLIGAAGVSSDKFRGSYYCTFVAPEYLVDVFKGIVTPPPASPELSP